MGGVTDSAACLLACMVVAYSSGDATRRVSAPMQPQAIELTPSFNTDQFENAENVIVYTCMIPCHCCSAQDQGFMRGIERNQTV